MKPEELLMTKADYLAARAVCHAEWSDFSNNVRAIQSGMQAERARVVTAIEATLRENKQGWFPPEGLDRNDVEQLFISLRDDILAGCKEVSK